MSPASGIYRILVVGLLTLLGSPRPAAGQVFNYLSSPVDVSPGQAGSWRQVNVSAWVPAGATGVIVEMVATGSDNDWGLRRNGSTDTWMPVGGGVARADSHEFYMIGVDGDRIFEVYTGDTAVKTWLLGYTMSGVTFLDNAVDKAVTTDESWEDVDISGDTGLDTAIGAIFIIQNTSSLPGGTGKAKRHVGLRPKGSSDDRWKDMQSLGATLGLVGVDANEFCQFFVQTCACDAKPWLVGYVTEGAVFLTTGLNKSTSTTDSYVDVDITGDIGSDDANGAIVELIPTVDSSFGQAGFRRNGALYDNYYEITHSWLPVEIDADDVFEQKIWDTEYDLFLIGYTLAAPLDPPLYVESDQAWTATAADTWEVKDLGPLGVPADAVVEVAVYNQATTAQLWGGVRAVGSGFARRFLLHEAEGGGWDVAVMHVQADAGGRIEHYADDTANVRFVLLGYWTAGTYAEAYQAFKAGGSGSWREHDLAAYGVSPGAVAEIVMVNNRANAERAAGVRAKGSGLPRTVTPHEIEGGGDDVATMFVQADSTANATIEVYTSNNNNVDFYVVGSWSLPPGAYAEAFSDIGSPTASGSWQDKDLAAFGVPADAVAEIMCANRQVDAEYRMGVRPNGTALNRTLDLQEAEDGGDDLGRMHVTADGASIVELYHENVIAAHTFRLTGFWEEQALLGLAEHDADQQPDAFRELGVGIGAELYGFSLNPGAGTRTVTELVLSLWSIGGLTDADWLNLELYVDDDGDGDLGPGETTAVGGGGVVDQAAGTITFFGDFDVSAPTDYVLVANFLTLSEGDMVTISLAADDITATVPVVGSASAATHREGCFYFERYQVWSATAADTWEVMDLAAAPFLVPADAVAEIAVTNAGTGAERWGGVRAVGSGLDRRFQLHEAEGGGTDVVVMHVQTDGSARIEHYADNTVQVQFTLLGYWDCGTYVEAYQVLTASTAATWEDLDLSTYGLGPDQVAEFVLANRDTASEWEAGVRKNGSMLQRRLDLHETEAGGVDLASMLVETDWRTDATIEIYAQNELAIDFYLVGYWSTAPRPYKELFFDIGSPAVDGTWAAVNLSGFKVSVDAVAEIMLTNSTTNNEDQVGARAGGSFRSRVLDLQEPEDGGSDLGRLHVATGDATTVELYHEDVSDTHKFLIVGYWGEFDTPKVITWQETEP